MSKSNNHTRALEVYNQHIAMAYTDPRLFRRTVTYQLMAEFGCSLAAASTIYNNVKKSLPPIEGLGRVPAPKGLKKPGTTVKGKVNAPVQDDDECYTVLELIDGKVHRTQSFLTQGDASEFFDEKCKWTPINTWVFIQGLGPNSGDVFKLDTGEKEIKRWDFRVETAKKLGIELIEVKVTPSPLSDYKGIPTFDEEDDDEEDF